ncbi:Nuclear pore protein [Trichostrongylus colubriformis]|uniref:Nuclear pore protein n=1 Tax=Trichostrongylus colubriformis TaxID=6319 RepID=A0AAN8F8F4_TRICO
MLNANGLATERLDADLCHDVAFPLKDLRQLFSDAVKESGTDGALVGVWSEVLALMDRKIPSAHDDPTTVALLIEKTCNYLQNLFVEHMSTQVERNLERAQRGGVPGTRGLVDAFLKVGADDPFAEDGTVGGLPVWEVTYHCLRAGDLSAAKDALDLLANFPQAAVLVACLNHLSKEAKSNGGITSILQKTSIKEVFTLLCWGWLLYDCGHISDAVHVAILTNEMGYLRNTADAAAEMLVTDSVQLTKCSFNIARLLVSYTKQFELEDIERALDYWYLLKGLQTPTGGDVFEMAVSRAVYLTGQTEAIIGTIGADGKRTRAWIDEYLEDCSDVITRVARDTELGGDTTQAVKLYVLANAPVKAVELLCTELSDAIRTNRTRMNELRLLAEEFVSSHSDIRSSVLSTLCILLDVCTLIDLCESGLADKALSVSQQLRLIPSEAEQVPVIVGEFHLVPQKVREVIPDLSLQLMRCMVDAIHSAASINARYTKQVKAIVIYAATVNYKFPQHITSKLLQLQASIAV